MREFKASTAEMMENDNLHRCLSTDETSKEWKMTYQQITKLLTKESSHFDAAIIYERPSFQRAVKLHNTIDKTVEIESGVRHIAGTNDLVIRIQSDVDLMEERRQVKLAVNKVFET